MKSLKQHFIHFLLFSFLMSVPVTASSATPDSEGFPPLPRDQELNEEDSHTFEKPPAPPVAPDGTFKRPPRPPKDADNIINYRGNRTYTENLPLKINHTNCERKADDIVCVEIVFNQSINPRSLHHDCFLLNNHPLPFGTRFTFNKKGNTIKLMVPSSVNSFKLMIQKISSFDGSEIEPIEILAEVKG